MRVFVTGGTGELGRPAVSALVARGNVVQVASRGVENDRFILSVGAVPVRVNLFDRESVLAAVSDAEAILHLATRIPATAKWADPASWADNDRLRRDTTAHLAAAAIQHRVETFVLQSHFAVGAPSGERWIDDRPRMPATPWSGIGAMDSMRDAELAMLPIADSGTRAVILRFGSLYSETSEQLHAQVDGLLAADPLRLAGDGGNFWPFIASRDAGDAVSHALTLASGTYWVSDDTPVTVESFWRMAAETAGAPAPVLGGEATGPMAAILLGSWRTSNRRFRHAARWTPQEACVLDGWPRAARSVLDGRELADLTRPALASSARRSASRGSHTTT
ncbi:MAG: NAD-dependent epimerase/dehydratase family protein [Solirubrobacteraceae bacterium]